MAGVRMGEPELREAMRDRRYWQSGNPEREDYGRWVTQGWQALGEARRAAGDAGARIQVEVAP